MHLVDDDGLHIAKGFARGRGEHQVEGLGGRDEDVGRGALQHPPVAGGGVARSHPDGDLGGCHPEALRRLNHSDERCPQVALHVDGERFERRDIEHPCARDGTGCGGRTGHRDEAVDRPHEGREGLT